MAYVDPKDYDSFTAWSNAKNKKKKKEEELDPRNYDSFTAWSNAKSGKSVDDDIAPVAEKKSTSIGMSEGWYNTFRDKWSKYTSEADYKQYSDVGAKTKNPSVKEAEGYANIFGWRPGADEVENIVTYSRDNAEAIAMGNLNSAKMVGNANYRWMTQEEVDMYNYLLAKSGKKKAQEFLDDIEEELNWRSGTFTADQIKSMEDGVAKALVYGLESFTSGVDSFGSGLKQRMTDKELPTSAMQFTSSGLAEDLEGFEGMLYSAGNTIGNMAPTIAAAGAASLVNPLLGKFVGNTLMGASASGNAYKQKLDEGYSEKQARLYGDLVGASEAVTSALLGGFSKLGGKALSKAVPGVGNLSNKIDMIHNVFGRVAAKYGESIVSEIGEEELQLFLEPLIGKIVLGEEYDAPSAEEMFETAIVTALSTGTLESSSIVQSEKRMTNSDRKVVQSVVDKEVSAREEKGEKLTARDKDKIYESVVERMEKGQIDIDTIESVLGGDKYKAYTDHVNNEEKLKTELNELRSMKSGDMNDIQTARMNELKEMNLDDTIKRDTLRKSLDDTLSPLLKNSRVAESYRERERRGQAFDADLSQYTGKQRAAVERAIKSGVLNNTYRSHELVDVLSKIEADKGIVFDYSNNAKLKESGFAVKGKTVNGFANKSKGSVTLNVQSSKAWQTVVGHEITHILETNPEAYNALRESLYAYAESKGELASRRAATTAMYSGMNADIEAELTADLVGDYLFTDKDFVNKLTGNRTLFQKIYDEIKYLWNVATGKEKTEIEKVKDEFDRVWNELSLDGTIEADDSGEADIDYSVSVTDKDTLDSLNKQVAKGEYDADTNPDGGYYVTYKSMSFWGYDKDGNAILRSPMAEYVDGELSNAYLIPKDKSKLNWYQATETIDENTGLPSGLLVKTKPEGKKSFSYLPASENQHLINEDWSNLYFNLRKKVQKNGKWVNSDVPARYNPYEHSSNSMLNDQFSAAYLRDNLVTVKMYVPVSEDNGACRAKWSKDPTGWSDWKTGTVAGKIGKQKDLQRRVYLSRYAAPVEIVPDSEVAQAYKGYLEGTDVAIPDNVVSPNLLKELRNAGVPIEESGKVQYSVSDSEGNELSLAVQKRFANSKAVDENGNLKVLYHGTASGEFYTFDKSKGSVEGDFGSGFYFSDNKRDVETNYEGGGADFENKVARLAERIEDEEDIDYHEAEERAREELFVGGNKFEVYLNIENPAVVGETILFDPEKYYEEYDREDYDSEEDYEGEVEQLIADDIDKIIWDIERNTTVFSSDGIAEVLWNAVNEGGIDIEQLKANINGLYLEDDMGNFVGNEVTRQIIESLGYDGIIDPTVSHKWNMDMDEGTTHYIVFKPNQIKSVTNQNPTDNPDIRYSLSNNTLDNGQEMVYNVRGGEGYVQTDEFRNLQAECKGMSDEDIQLYHSGSKQIDDELRENLSQVLRTQINTYRNGLRNDDGLLRLSNKGNEFNMCKSVDGSLFRDVFEIAQKHLRNGELVDLHDVETTDDGIGYNDCHNYLSEDGLSGFSITPDGDLISVFNASGKSGFLGAIAPVVKSNAKTLDCYNSPNQPLRAMYEKMFGFKTASVMDYNMEYDHDNIAENHGMPQVAFMVNTDSVIETKHFTKDQYDEAVAYRNGFVASDDIAPVQNSLSYKGEDIAPVGNYSIPLKDLALEDIAPVKESVAPVSSDRLDLGNIPVLPDEELDTGTYEPIKPEKPVAKAEEVPKPGIDKDSFISNKALALYNEVKGMRKGVRVSDELSRLLDNLDLSEENKADSYNKLRTALMNIKNRPGQVVNEHSAIESIARELIGDAYDTANYEVDDLVAIRLKKVQDNIEKNKANRSEAYASFEKQIAKKQAELASKKNQNTKVVNTLKMQIARMERLRDSTDAQYAKSIKTLEERAEKMQDPKYSRAMRRRAKMQEHAKWAADLLGNTATWVDKKLGLQYATNTERRNLRDIVRDANGKVDIAHADRIDDALNGQYNREEAQRQKELAQKRGKFADLHLTNEEDAYIQMLGEFRHNPDTRLTWDEVSEYYEKHKNKINTETVDYVIEEARRDYDGWFARVNAELRKQGMREIPYRQGYFPHLKIPKQNFIQKLFNWKTQDNEIPTSIAGLTEDFKPSKSWQSFDKHREGDKTDYSFMQGYDAYSEGVTDWIYHLDTLQKRRAVENHIRYTHSDEGIKGRIKEVYANEEWDANEAQDRITQILSEAKNPLNNFVQDFTTHTNILTGKKNSLDRTTEQMFNRKIYSVMTNVQSRLSANMVLANVRSAMTNFIPITQSWAQVSPLRSLEAAKETIANSIKDDGTVAKSTFLTNRLKAADKLYKTNWDKVLDKAGIMFEVVDNFSSQVIWRSKYNQNLADGMSEAEAIQNADQFAMNVLAGRSKGTEPTLFNAKSPFIKAFTMFQLEVNNQYGYLFKDVPNDLKAETEHWKINLAKGYATAFVGAYVYNAILERVTGSEAAFDPIGILEDLLKDLGLFGEDEEEETVGDALGNLKDNILEQVPFVGGYLGGGRLPISNALPVKELVSGKDSYGNEKSRLETLGEALPYHILPFGYGQIKKTAQGLGMFSDDHPVSGSYTDSGKLRFPVEDTLLNRAQAAVFGQYASKNAREYFDNGYAPLGEKQIQEYIDVDIPIKDYWEYREGLNDIAPLPGNKSVTLNQKGDYIGSLGLPASKKNILINNIADRSKPIDMTTYNNFKDFEEFDFAQRYPEKYAVLKEQGISVEDYKKNLEESTFLYTDDYSWAADNPDKYTLSKVISDDVTEYKRYASDLNAIKGENKKEDKRRYIFNLDIDYGAKCVLFKAQYNADDTYNADIVRYITSRSDLTYEEKVTVLTEIGFRVTADGQIYAE